MMFSPLRHSSRQRRILYPWKLGCDMKNFAESGSRGWRSKMRNANEGACCCLHARGCGLMALPAGRTSDHNSSGWSAGNSRRDHIDPRYMRSSHPSRSVKTFGLVHVMRDLIVLICVKSKVFPPSFPQSPSSSGSSAPRQILPIWHVRLVFGSIKKTRIMNSI